VGGRTRQLDDFGQLGFALDQREQADRAPLFRQAVRTVAERPAHNPAIVAVWWSQFQELLLSASPLSSAVTSARKRSRGAE
jgi:hypothetical protein